MERCNLDIIGYWVIGAGCSIEKNLELSPGSPNCSKDSWKLLPLFISINWPNLVTEISCSSKDVFKNTPSRTTTHHDVTYLVSHGMVKSTKTWLTQVRNIFFQWNKKNLNLCLRWHILRSYRFVAKVSFIYLLKRRWSWSYILWTVVVVVERLLTIWWGQTFSPFGFILQIWLKT